MIAITTSSSISVKARVRGMGFEISGLRFNMKPPIVKRPGNVFSRTNTQN